MRKQIASYGRIFDIMDAQQACFFTLGAFSTISNARFIRCVRAYKNLALKKCTL